LELHLGARLARAQRLLVLAPFGGGAQHFPARLHPLQAVLNLDLAHDFFGALLALPLADDLPVEVHPRGHNVYVVLLRPPVLDDEVWGVFEPHFLDVGVGNFLPLLDGQAVALGGADGDVVNRLFKARSQLFSEAELTL
jgi:hypothetical protein